MMQFVYVQMLILIRDLRKKQMQKDDISNGRRNAEKSRSIADPLKQSKAREMLRTKMKTKTRSRKRLLVSTRM
jgi:hypothetical protein